MQSVQDTWKRNVCPGELTMVIYGIYFNDNLNLQPSFCKVPEEQAIARMKEKAFAKIGSCYYWMSLWGKLVGRIVPVSPLVCPVSLHLTKDVYYFKVIRNESEAFDLLVTCYLS